jgi:hypothetical protein
VKRAWDPFNRKSFCGIPWIPRRLTPPLDDKDCKREFITLIFEPVIVSSSFRGAVGDVESMVYCKLKIIVAIKANYVMLKIISGVVNMLKSNKIGLITGAIASVVAMSSCGDSNNKGSGSQLVNSKKPKNDETKNTNAKKPGAGAAGSTAESIGTDTDSAIGLDSSSISDSRPIEKITSNHESNELEKKDSCLIVLEARGKVMKRNQEEGCNYLVRKIFTVEKDFASDFKIKETENAEALELKKENGMVTLGDNSVSKEFYSEGMKLTEFYLDHSLTKNEIEEKIKKFTKTQGSFFSPHYENFIKYNKYSSGDVWLDTFGQYIADDIRLNERKKYIPITKEGFDYKLNYELDYNIKKKKENRESNESIRSTLAWKMHEENGDFPMHVTSRSDFANQKVIADAVKEKSITKIEYTSFEKGSIEETLWKSARMCSGNVDLMSKKPLNLTEVNRIDVNSEKTADFIKIIEHTNNEKIIDYFNLISGMFHAKGTDNKNYNSEDKLKLSIWEFKMFEEMYKDKSLVMSEKITEKDIDEYHNLQWSRIFGSCCDKERLEPRIKNLSKKDSSLVFAFKVLEANNYLIDSDFTLSVLFSIKMKLDEESKIEHERKNKKISNEMSTNESRLGMNMQNSQSMIAAEAFTGSSNFSLGKIFSIAKIQDAIIGSVFATKNMSINFGIKNSEKLSHHAFGIKLNHNGLFGYSEQSFGISNDVKLDSSTFGFGYELLKSKFGIFHFSFGKTIYTGEYQSAKITQNFYSASLVGQYNISNRIGIYAEASIKDKLKDSGFKVSLRIK